MVSEFTITQYSNFTFLENFEEYASFKEKFFIGNKEQ